MTADPKLDGMRADQLAALCPCSDVVVVTMSAVYGIGKDRVHYTGRCDTCGRALLLDVEAARAKKIADPGDERPPFTCESCLNEASLNDGRAPAVCSDCVPARGAP